MVPARGRSAAKRAPTPGRRFMLPRARARYQQIGNRPGGSPWYSCKTMSYTLRVAQLRGQMRFEPLAGFEPATSTIRRVCSIH
jgi:hypothetical protein